MWTPLNIEFRFFRFNHWKQVRKTKHKAISIKNTLAVAGSSMDSIEELSDLKRGTLMGCHLCHINI